MNLNEVKKKIITETDVSIKTDILNEYILTILFADTSINKQILFKGGTSLYKYFDFMNRVSQDIVLCISDINTIPLIKEILSKEGLKISKKEDNDSSYGESFRVELFNAGDLLTFTQLDLSKYLKFNTIKSGSHALEINGVSICVFPVQLTFLEKILAAHNFLEVHGNFSKTNFSDIETTRKIRHIFDITELNKNKVIVFKESAKINYYARLAMENEINSDKLNGFQHYRDLKLFQEENIEYFSLNFKKMHKDKYNNGSTYPRIETIKEELEKIKANIGAIPLRS